MKEKVITRTLAMGQSDITRHESLIKKELIPNYTGGGEHDIKTVHLYFLGNFNGDATLPLFIFPDGTMKSKFGYAYSQNKDAGYCVWQRNYDETYQIRYGITVGAGSSDDFISNPYVTESEFYELQKDSYYNNETSTIYVEQDDDYFPEECRGKYIICDQIDVGGVTYQKLKYLVEIHDLSLSLLPLK